MYPPCGSHSVTFQTDSRPHDVTMLRRQLPVIIEITCRSIGSWDRFPIAVPITVNIFIFAIPFRKFNSNLCRLQLSLLSTIL